MEDQSRPVPVKTILVTIALVLASLAAVYVVVLLAHIEVLLVISAFFAVVLTQPVNFFRRHLHVSRGLATTLVFVIGIGVFSAMLYAFIRPLVTQVSNFADHFPRYVADAKAGKGPVGDLVKRYKLDQKLDQNKTKIENWLTSAGGGAVNVARSVFNGVISLLTILVLAVLMILYGPELLAGGLAILSPPTQVRVKAVAGDCARALTGYVMGNLLISVIAGTLTFVALWAFGVPFRGVLALWVGFADLIPLVGATLGAIPTIAVAFLHSTAAGIGIIVVYVVYQQFENHVLQVVIMSKTVQINQLFVLVSVLIGVELAGLVGALLAIPAAGVIQVVVRDLWDHRAGRFKSEPTIGEDQVPVSEHLAREGDAGDEPPTEDKPGGDAGAQRDPGPGEAGPEPDQAEPDAEPEAEPEPEQVR